MARTSSSKYSPLLGRKLPSQLQSSFLFQRKMNIYNLKFHWNTGSRNKLKVENYWVSKKDWINDECFFQRDDLIFWRLSNVYSWCLLFELRWRIDINNRKRATKWWISRNWLKSHQERLNLLNWKKYLQEI